MPKLEIWTFDISFNETSTLWRKIYLDGNLYKPVVIGSGRGEMLSGYLRSKQSVTQSYSQHGYTNMEKVKKTIENEFDMNTILINL